MNELLNIFVVKTMHAVAMLMHPYFVSMHAIIVTLSVFYFAAQMVYITHVLKLLALIFFKYLSSCAFLPNNGGFFIGYIITAALIGTSLEWIRIVTFVQYVYLRLSAKSSAQKAYANKVRD